MIHLVIPRATIQTAMGPALGELQEVLRAQGVKPTGPWFAHHLRRPADTFDFEVSLPVHVPVAAQGRVTNGVVAAGRAGAARTNFRGGYEELPHAWSELWRGSRGQGMCSQAISGGCTG